MRRGRLVVALCAVVVVAGCSGGGSHQAKGASGTTTTTVKAGWVRSDLMAVSQPVVAGGEFVVYVSAGAPDDNPPGQAAKFEQKGCQYIPHVLAFQVNQSLEISNADQTSHNIHPLPKVNREWNKSQPPGSAPIVDKYDKPEFIPVKCNIHPWMHGNFAVLKNSHYAVTEGEGGFSLAGLPPGKYTITAWHESYGDQSQDVTISGSETKTVNFTFKAKPY